MRSVHRALALGLVALMIALPEQSLAQTRRLTCVSDRGRYQYCRADTQNRVELAKTISFSPCAQGYSWGFDYRGIWVDRGCAAEFIYGRESKGGRDGAVAAGILGAVLLGAVIGAAASQDKSDRNGGDYYRDGYRCGQRDWDGDHRPDYLAHRDRFSPEFENDFAAGYNDGYNNRPNRYR